MEDETKLPIEMGPDSLVGVVRGRVIAVQGETLPDLAAHRPAAWRFLRLSRVFGIAQGLVAAELGGSAARTFAEAMIRLEDQKGDFTIYWRPGSEQPLFEAALNRALALENETEVLHVVGDPEPTNRGA